LILNHFGDEARNAIDLISLRLIFGFFLKAILGFLVVKNMKNSIYLKNSKTLFGIALCVVSLYYTIVEINLPISITVLGLVYCLSVGFLEEALCRDVIYTNLRKRYGMIVSLFLASTIFGLLHFGNMFHKGMDPLSVVNQVWGAFILGVLFQAIYIRYGNLLLVACVHGCINLLGSYKTLILNERSITSGGEYEFYPTFLFMLVFFIVLVLPISLFLISTGKNKLACDVI